MTGTADRCPVLLPAFLHLPAILRPPVVAGGAADR